MPRTKFGYFWEPQDAIPKRPLPTYDDGDGISQMLDECLRLCPNDPLLNSFWAWFEEREELSPRQYANLKRFYDAWGGNDLP